MSIRRSNIKTRHSLLHIFFSVLTVFLLLFASTHDVRASDVSLAWDPNPEPIVQGYRVYFGKASGFYTNVVDAGNRTDCVITGLDGGTTYYFACTAYSATGDESNFSNEVVYTPQGGSSSGSSSGSGQCFIATAAYGSALAEEVDALRQFRDRHLLTNRPGRAFVDWYYRVSPDVAAYITEHEILRTAVRLGLTPVVYGIRYPAVLLTICLVPVVIIIRKGCGAKGRG